MAGAGETADDGDDVEGLEDTVDEEAGAGAGIGDTHHSREVQVIIRVKISVKKKVISGVKISVKKMVITGVKSA